MGKPFKLDGSATRDQSGRFSQPTPPAPPKVVDDARKAGVNVDDHIAEIAVTDHPTPGGAPRGDEIPWPKVEGAKKPMRVG